MDKKMVSGLAVAAALAGVGGGKAYASSKEEENVVAHQVGQGEVEAMKVQLEQVTASVAKAEELVATDQAAYNVTLSDLSKQERALKEADDALLVAQKEYDLAAAQFSTEQGKAQQATPEAMGKLRTEIESVKATVNTLQASANQATAEAVANAQALETKKEAIAALNRQKQEAESGITLLKQRLSEQEAALAGLEEPRIISYLGLAQQGVENAKQLVAEAEKRLAAAKEADGDKANELALAKLTLDTATKTFETAQSDYLKAQEAATKARETLAAIEADPGASQPPKTVDLPPVRLPELSQPEGNNVFVGVQGTFATPTKEAILNRINAIREEAYQQGLIDTYVEMKWSRTLEEMAMVRVAESGVTHAHTRLTDKDWSSVEDAYPKNWSIEDAYPKDWYNNPKDWYSESDPERFEIWEESLGFTTSAKEQAFLETIEQFYREKGANYEALINPEYTHLGMAAFNISNVPNTTAVLQLFASEETLNGELVGGYGEVRQELEADFADLSAIGVNGETDTLYLGREPVALSLTATLTSRYKAEQAPASVPVDLLSGVSWVSTDPTVAMVDDKGVVTPLKPGTVSIRAIYRGLAYAKTLVVKEALDRSKAQELLDKAQADVRTTETAYQRAQAAFETAKSSYETLLSRELLTPAAQEQYDRYQSELQKTVELEQRIREVKTVFEKEKASKSAMVDAAKAQVLAKEKEVADLSKKLVAENEALIAHEVNLASFQSRVVVRQAELATVSERLNSLRQRLAVLEASGNQLQEAEKALQSAQTLLRTKQSAVTAVTGKVTTLKAQADILKQKLAAAQKALEEVRARQLTLRQTYSDLLKAQAKTEELVKQYQAILDKGGFPVPVYDDKGQITGYTDRAASSANIGVTSQLNASQGTTSEAPSTAGSPVASTAQLPSHVLAGQVTSQVLPTSSTPITSPAPQGASQSSGNETNQNESGVSAPQSTSTPSGNAAGASYGNLPKTGDEVSNLTSVAGLAVTTAAMTAIKRRKKEEDK